MLVFFSLIILVLSFISGCGLLLPDSLQEKKPENITAPVKDKVVFRKQPISTSGKQPGRSGTLTEWEMEMAKIAWRYFQNNYNKKTGFVNAVNAYPSVTMWDLASYLGGLVAVYELEIIDKQEFDSRMLALIKALNKIELYRKQVPNKVYHTKTMKKVDYTNKPGEIGYSALDIGRLLIWLKIIKERYPYWADGIDRAVLRWNFCHIVDKNGTMFGALGKKGAPIQYVQEGRLGYEEYAAKGFQLWGFDTTRASNPEPYDVIKLYSIPVPYDSRDPRTLNAHNYVVVESYVLDGLELNWDLASDRASDDNVHTLPWMADFAKRIFKVQEERYLHTGILTARTEHQLDRSPYFVYDTIYSDGFAWNTITEKGAFVPQFSAIALKGALGLWALWDSSYTDLLFDAVSHLYNDKGFFEGRYENGGGAIQAYTSNNNGIILESLLYKAQGKLLKFTGHSSYWDTVVNDEFMGQGKCLPGKR